MTGIRTTRRLSKGVRTILGCLKRGIKTCVGKRKRNDVYDKFSRDSHSSNAEEEDSVNQGSVTSDNSNLPDDDQSSADDKNPENQGSDTINNSNLPDDNSSEGDESNGNSNDKCSGADLVLKGFHFNENEGMKIDVPADNNPLFFFNLFVTDQLLNKLVIRSNAYAQKVINSTFEKKKCFKHLERCNCHKNEAVPRISLTYETCCHASMHVLLVSGLIVSKRTFQVSNDKRQIYINNAISKF